METFNARVVTMLREASDRGELRCDLPAELAAQNAFAAYFAVLVGWLRGLIDDANRDAQLHAALELQIQGLGAGSVAWPTRTFRAFVRGLRSRNLYRERFDNPLLDQSLEATRERLGLAHDGHAATAPEIARFRLWLTIGWGSVLVPVELIGLGLLF